MPNRTTWKRPRPSPGTLHTELPNSLLANKLGPDGRLTPAEHQCRMNLGLCMHCGQSGHLARGCPKQNARPTSLFEGRGIVLQQEAEKLELQKKTDAVSSFSRDPTM